MSKPSSKEEIDDSVLKILPLYRRKCESIGIPMHPILKSKLQLAAQQNKFEQLQLSSQIHQTQQANKVSIPFSAMQMRALAQSLTDIKFDKLKSLRIWKGKIGDEGVRMICKLISSGIGSKLQVIDLLDNSITELGCQFLGKWLSLCNIKTLRLDDNLINNNGLKSLAVCLAQNPTIDKLSLKYCNITTDGSKYIQEIIAFAGSKLRSLKLQGNPLMNEGVFQVLRAVNCSQSLQKIGLADTGMNLLPYQPDTNTIECKIGQLLVSMMKKNMLIIKYDIRFSQLHDQIAEQLLSAVQNNKRIKKMEFPLNVKYQFRDALDTILRKRNKTGKTKTSRAKTKSKASTKR